MGGAYGARTVEFQRIVPSPVDIANIFKTLREVDLNSIREQAERQTWIAIVGAEERTARELASCLYLSPRALPAEDASRRLPGPIVTTLEHPEPAERADLIILVLDDTTLNLARAHDLVAQWSKARKSVIVVYPRDNETPRVASGEWMGACVLEGSLTQREFLEKQFVPAILASLPERHLALARNFPLWRVAVANKIINDTCMANAGYSFSTGLGEVMPVLNVPLNVADMLVLTKAQAFMVYKLGLIFGLSPRWQDHLAAFGGTIGAGFLWRTLARQLVGLIPGLGIIPKVAVAYAGTYAVGQAVLRWYESGREITPKDVEEYFREALKRGQRFARELLMLAPRSRKAKLR